MANTQQKNKNRQRTQSGVKAVASIPAQATETPEVPVTEAVVVEPKHRIRKGLRATGHGLRSVGRAVIDTDLRDVGQGVKTLGHKIPRIQIVREDQEVNA
jgi:hypothetical protein